MRAELRHERRGLRQHLFPPATALVSLLELRGELRDLAPNGRGIESAGLARRAFGCPRELGAQCHDRRHQLRRFGGELQRNIAAHAVAEECCAFNPASGHEMTDAVREAIDAVLLVGGRRVAVTIQLDDVDVVRVVEQCSQRFHLCRVAERTVNQENCSRHAVRGGE